MEGREHEFAGIGFIAGRRPAGSGHLPRPRRVRSAAVSRPLSVGSPGSVGTSCPSPSSPSAPRSVGKGQSLRRARLALGWGLLGLVAARAAARRARSREDHGQLRHARSGRRMDRRARRRAAAQPHRLRRRHRRARRGVCRRRLDPDGRVVADDAEQHRQGCRCGRRAHRAQGAHRVRQRVDVEERPSGLRRAADADHLRRRTRRGLGRAAPSRAKPKAPRTLPAPGSLDPGLVEQSELELGPGAQRGQWVLPPANYLNKSAQQTINKAEVEARGRTLVDALNSHGVETKLLGQTVGPTVTRYELELGSGVKVARVTSLNRDIAYAMAATDVRILAPIPGRTAIGVEVPNHTRQLVSLGDIMSSPEAKTASHPLDVAIGKDIAGRSVFLNLATTPHLLIAGTTGAGKSSGLNCILTSHPHAQHARPGAADPHRPQAGRDGPVQPAAAPADPAGDEPEEGRQRARLGGQGDGASLRPVVRGRLPRHRRLQRGIRPRRTEARAGIGASSSSGFPTSSSSSTSSTT